MSKRKKPLVCPYCGADSLPTNKYLRRCVNHKECGRYF